MTPTPQMPGVYVEEVVPGFVAIPRRPTADTAFLGRTATAPPRDAYAPDAPAVDKVTSFAQFEARFGAADAALPMTLAVRDFFAAGGTTAHIVRIAPRSWTPHLVDADLIGDADARTGLHALADTAFQLLCIPPDVPEGTTSTAVYTAALAMCVARRALLLADAPADWKVGDVAWLSDRGPTRVAAIAIGETGEALRNAALYFPRLRDRPDADGLEGPRRVASGAVAGLMARIDQARGVWQAPAGVEATLSARMQLDQLVTNAEQDILNRAGVNALRQFARADAPVVFGARTLRGADAFADEHKYVPVRRLALHIEDCLVHGLQWTVFEPNASALHARVRQSVLAFLHDLFREGAFQGIKAEDACYVRCGTDTMSAIDLAQGRLRLVVGFAPLRPMEFVTLQVTLAAQSVSG